MKNLRKSNGSVSVLVLITILTMIAVLVTAYMVGNTQRKAQLQSEIKLKEVYEETIDNAGKIYEDVNNKKIALDKKTLPYTSSTRPYLPNDGFSRIIGTDLNNGLVIEDSEGNQFVWVEVPKTTAVYATSGINITTFTSANYTTIKNDLINYAKDYRRADYNDEWYDGCGIETSAKYTELYNKMLKSVYEHGGFWIGRYEIGIKENTGRAFSGYKDMHSISGQTPVVQANHIPYNWITCKQAESFAEYLAPTGYNGSLLFGIQWDLTCKHLETKGTNPGSTVSTIQAAIKTNSKDWGNYKNSGFQTVNRYAKYSLDMGATWVQVTARGYEKEVDVEALITTGSSTKNSMLNIYDFAGNEYEWTLEKAASGDSLCTARGGYFRGQSTAAASNRTHNRNNSNNNHNSYSYGARMAIY